MSRSITEYPVRAFKLELFSFECFAIIVINGQLEQRFKNRT